MYFWTWFSLSESAAAQPEAPGDQSRPTEQQQRRQGAIPKQPQNFNLAFGGNKDGGFNLEKTNFPDLGSNSVKPSPARSNPEAQSEPSGGNVGGWVSKTTTGNPHTGKTTPTEKKNTSKESETEWPSVSSSSSQQGMMKFDQSVKSTPKTSYASAAAKKGKTQTQNQEITNFFEPTKK